MQKGMQWPIGVAVILALTVAGNIYVAFRANDDPSFSVESDYYQKAVRFDAEQALRKRSERLGWKLSVTATPNSADAATVTATLVDSTGTPVRGATLRVTATAVARGNDPVVGTAREEGDHYAASLPMARRGLWDLNFEATRGSDRFVSETRVELPASH